MKKIAIIGSGYTALSLAKKLVEEKSKDIEVTIFEKTDEIGGIAKCIDAYGTRLEKHYRHIFKSDKYVLELLEDLGLSDKMQWPETKMAYYSEKGLYAFGTPFTLLKYKPLSFIEKMIFGFSIVKIKLMKDYKKIEKYTAEEWMIKNCGEKIYQKIWEPLLFSKFGNEKSKISMSWLWGKINLRSTSGTLEGERLGYLDGSYDVLTQKLNEFLLSNNCKILLNEEVTKVSKENNIFLLETKEGVKEKFDFVVNTACYDITKNIFDSNLTDEEKKKMENLKHTSAKTLVIYTTQSFSKFYWTNIGDKSIPFGGIIEHTNMIDKEKYQGTNIIYISNYMDKNDKLFSMNENELFDEYLPYLQKINPEFKKENVKKLEIYEELYAQPVITTNYSDSKIDEEITEKGIYMGTMAQIYPEDRGMNYAIRTGYEIADKILEKC